MQSSVYSTLFPGSVAYFNRFLVEAQNIGIYQAFTAWYIDAMPKVRGIWLPFSKPTSFSF